MRIRKQKLVTAISLALLGANVPISVFAQESYALEEIVVTATKRASSAQDVPIAVTVLTPEALEQQGVTNIKDLVSVSPGIIFSSTQTETQGTSIRIRGVGTTGNNIGLESAVGVFIDGVYQSRPGVALGELTDVEAVELLRGPQGTLFGRNTSAGALNIRTQKPSFEEVGGFANLTVGDFGLTSIQGGINLPASDNLGFRFTGAFRERDGFSESPFGVESNDRDRFLIKGQAYWEPSDETSVRVIADYSEVDERCCASVALTPASFLSPAAVADTTPITNDVDSLGINEDLQFRNGFESTGLSVELEHDFGNSTLTAIASYRDYSSFSSQGDFLANDSFTVPNLDDDIETFTAEIRLQGTAFNDRLDWLIGGYYADESISELFAFRLGEDFGSNVGGANFGVPGFLGLLSGAGSVLQQLAQGVTSPVFAPISNSSTSVDNFFTQDAESFSVFTHNIISVTDSLDLTLGARYVDDSKDGAFDQLDANTPACNASLTALGSLTADPSGTVAALAPHLPAGVLEAITGPGGGPAAFLNCVPLFAPAVGSEFAPAAFAGIPFLPNEFDDTFSDEEFIYTVKLGYTVSDDLLLFAGFTHGYKSGGFNLDPTAAAGAAAGTGADPRFNSEEVDSFEVGLKSTLADGRVRLNITGFLSEFDDFQVNDFTGTNFETFNVADVSSTGVEAELNARLSPGFTLNAGITYADAEYGSNCDAGGTIVPAITLCGSDLTLSPKLSTVLGLTYLGTIGQSGWGVLANLNVSTQSSRRTSIQPNSFDDEQPSFAKVNARLGFTTPNENITIELWGLNLTDEITINQVFGTPFLGDSRQAFIEPPRQYGVTLRTQF